MGKNEKNIITDSNIKLFVNDLFKKHNIGIKDFGSKLAIKYNHNVAEIVRDIFLKKYKLLENRATKLAALVQEKYKDQNIPFHIILEKTKIFKNKYGLSDDEYHTFQRIYEQEFSDEYKKRINLPSNTNMMKLLGTTYTETSIAPFKLDDINMKYLQEILKKYALTKQLHTNIFLQSILYEGCMNLGNVTNYIHNIKYIQSNDYSIFDYVHPILVALFLPKLNCIDEYFIQCNLGEIISNRYNNEPITNFANKQLIFNLSTDVNDIVCNNKSPLYDLLMRTDIQQHLWHCVINMRQNKFYTKNCLEFLNSLSNCKLNKYDNPDLSYGKNDLTLLKRLFNAFAFKPTVVITQRIGNTVHYNPYFRAFRPHSFKIPMINIRPGTSKGHLDEIFYKKENIDDYNLQDNDKKKRIFDLSCCLNKRDIIRYSSYDFQVNTSILYSKLLVFYIDRRFINIDLGFMKNPYHVSSIPSVIHDNFYQLSEDIITISPPDIEINNNKFKLVSVICSETMDKKKLNNKNNYIIGSSAYVSCYDKSDSNICTYYKYNPTLVKQDNDSVLYKAYSGTPAFSCSNNISLFNNVQNNIDFLDDIVGLDVTKYYKYDETNIENIKKMIDTLKTYISKCREIKINLTQFDTKLKEIKAIDLLHYPQLIRLLKEAEKIIIRINSDNLDNCKVNNFINLKFLPFTNNVGAFKIIMDKVPYTMNNLNITKILDREYSKRLLTLTETLFYNSSIKRIIIEEIPTGANVDASIRNVEALFESEALQLRMFNCTQEDIKDFHILLKRPPNPTQRNALIDTDDSNTLINVFTLLRLITDMDDIVDGGAPVFLPPNIQLTYDLPSTDNFAILRFLHILGRGDVKYIIKIYEKIIIGIITLLNNIITTHTKNIEILQKYISYYSSIPKIPDDNNVDYRDDILNKGCIFIYDLLKDEDKKNN